MRIRLLIIGALLSLVSCSIKIDQPMEEGDLKLSDSFVNWFFKFNRLDLFSESTGLTEDFIFLVQGGFDEYFTPEHNSKDYSHYCDIFEDHGFNMYLSHTHQASVNSIESMNIYSDSDFPSHKAGESLNDIVFARIKTAKPFIDNNYPESMLEEDPIRIDGVRVLAPCEGYSVVEKKLSELSSADCTLMSRNFKLRFIEKPIEQKDVSIFFEVVETNGEILSTSDRLNFYKDYRVVE